MKKHRNMFVVLLVLFICSVHFQEPMFAAVQDECLPTSCDASEPVIRFPFRLIGRQPERCGYPGFDLSCSSTNTTEFEFQYPVRASARSIILPLSARATVRGIDYLNQVIRISLLDRSCLPNRVPQQNNSVTLPFEIYSYSTTRYGYPAYTLFNCSRKPADSPAQSSGPIACLGHGGFQVYAYSSHYAVTGFPFSSCMKMYNIYDVPNDILPSRLSFLVMILICIGLNLLAGVAKQTGYIAGPIIKLNAFTYSMGPIMKLNAFTYPMDFCTTSKLSQIFQNPQAEADH